MLCILYCKNWQTIQTAIKSQTIDQINFLKALNMWNSQIFESDTSSMIFFLFPVMVKNEKRQKVIEILFESNTHRPASLEPFYNPFGCLIDSH